MLFGSSPRSTDWSFTEMRIRGSCAGEQHQRERDSHMTRALRSFPRRKPPTIPRPDLQRIACSSSRSAAPARVRDDGGEYGHAKAENENRDIQPDVASFGTGLRHQPLTPDAQVRERAPSTARRAPASAFHEELAYQQPAPAPSDVRIAISFSRAGGAASSIWRRGARNQQQHAQPRRTAYRESLKLRTRPSTS